MGLVLATLWFGLVTGMLAVLYKLQRERRRVHRVLLGEIRRGGRAEPRQRAEERLRGVLGQSPSFLFPLGEAYALRRLAETALEQYDENGGDPEVSAAARGLYERVLRNYASLWVRVLSGSRGRTELGRIHAGLACVAERLGDWAMALREAREARLLLDPEREEERGHLAAMDELVSRASCCQGPRAEGSA